MQLFHDAALSNDLGVMFLNLETALATILGAPSAPIDANELVEWLVPRICSLTPEATTVREIVRSLFATRTRLVRGGGFDYEKLPTDAPTAFRLVANVLRAVLLDIEVAVGLNATAT